MEPARFDEMRRGCYDIEARVADMDLDGVYATLCFPSLIAGFAGTIFAKSKDPELGLACLRAWNDWHIEEWAGPHPDRIIPLQLAWLHDPEIAAADVRRNAERGFKAVSFPENPVDLEAAVDAHRSLGSVPARVRGDADRRLPAQRIVVVDRGPLARRAARAVHVACSRSTRSSPRPTGCGRGSRPASPRSAIAFSEGGIGWVPMLIDRIDYVLDHSAVGSHGWDDPNLSPTDALRRNFWFCTIDIPSTMSLREHIGIDHICLESDYPHADSTWPDTQLRALAGLGDFTADEVRKVTWENASNLFRHPVPAELQLPRPRELRCST